MNTETGMTGHPTIIQFETMSGVMLYITPLNLATVRAIQQKAQEVYPYPEKAPYELPLENTFSPDTKDSAENNPEYVLLCAEVDKQRRMWADRAVFDYAVRFPAYPTRQDVINAFAPRLLELRKIAVLPEDDYDAILMHIILSGNEVKAGVNGLMDGTTEYLRVILAAMQTLPLTGEEIANGIRFFRIDVSRTSVRGMARGA